MARPCLTIKDGSGGKGDAIPVTYEKDEVWGSGGRRPLATTRVPLPPTHTEGPGADRMAGADFVYPATETSAYGPEAVERAQTMAYERMTRIQQESPYVAEEVVEHVVHDQRLYVGMWVTAGVAAVSAFLTFSVACLVITAVALAFALSATPGRQRKY